MLQFKTRTNSLNYNDKDRPQINEDLSALQQKFGKEFSNPREAFEFMISYLLSTENREPETIEVEVEKEIIPENALILADLISVTKVHNAIKEIRLNNSMFSEVSTNEEILDFALQSVLNPAEIQTVEKQLEGNQLILTITDQPQLPYVKKMELLDEIQKRRASKLGVTESIPELLEKMIFNDNIIFNLGGEFYTGF